MKNNIIIYTDGSCKKKVAGSGIYFPDGEYKNISEFIGKNSTNNIAELMAIKIAIDTVLPDENILIHSDSQYSINSITKWYASWIKKPKILKKKKNLQLIKSIVDFIDLREGKVSFQHVYAHTGIEGNEKADKLANYAVDNA